MVVKNIDGSSERKCKCGSRLQHWIRFADHPKTFCSAQGCFHNDIIGAMVQKDGGDDDNWYIVPLCSKHLEASSLQLKSGIQLVSSNYEKTCGG